MSHNIEITHKRSLLIFSSITLGMILLSSFLFACQKKEAEAVSSQSTLVFLHGKEIEEVIKEYWLHVESLETRKNPKQYYEFATGDLADMLYSSAEKVDYAKEPFITEIKSADVTDVRIIEYNPSRFKATACSKLETEDLKPDGTIIKTNVFNHCWVFVFIRQDEKWKALGYLSTTDPASYKTAPAWLQRVIGEMP